MKIILVCLLVSVLVVREISALDYAKDLSDRLYNYKTGLENYFNSLRSDLQVAIGNYDQHRIHEALAASKLCSAQTKNSTLDTSNLENTMQARIEQLEKKLQETVGQLLRANDTCNCRTISEDNFQKIGNKFYRFENQLKLNWFAANKRCQQLGAHLSSLQGEEELEKLRGNLTETDYWLGISDLGIPGEYRVSTTGQTAEVLLWANAEPKNDDGESHCVKLQRTGSDYAMGTKACKLEFNFICEKVVFEDSESSNEGCWLDRKED